jgi:hypothetical protein
MKMPHRSLVVVAVLWSALWLLRAPATASDAAYLAGLESIHSEELDAHVRYLADDALEGREAGTAGGRKAGDYLAAQLEGLHLRGAGVDGGYFQPFGRGFLALVEGRDPELKRQYVVVGAHYDHLGYGNKRASRGPLGQIYNGADDNGSGTSALLELAEAFTVPPAPPKRSILFAFWDAEEKGLLGSKHWVKHPTVPLKAVRVMLNADMIGRLRDERLDVFGTRSGYGWRRLLGEANRRPALELKFPWKVKRDSDHWPFWERGTPVLEFSTGMHDDYHRPSDDAERIHVEGMCRVTQLEFTVAYDLANREDVTAFRAAGRAEHDEASQGPLPALKGLLDGMLGRPKRLAIDWEQRSAPEQGVWLTGVVAGSSADEAGLEPGDRIVTFAGRPIRTSDELTWAVASAASPAPLVVIRSAHEGPLELSVRLDGNPMRLGIYWRTDEAEPGAVILTYVVPGSPAAQAGLQPGDYVYQIDGHDFTDDAQFAQKARTLPGPLRLLVERGGRLRTAEIQLKPQPVRRAA